MREICRNFQRGSCHYGDRCKYMHVVQQQRKPNNAFGFGGQGGGVGGGSYQHQNANRFGFGNSQLKGAQQNGFKQGQFKPFENKWTRDSSTSQNGSLRPSDKNSQSSNHECTDPVSCKRQIEEDFKHEKPLWRLTCYGHSKRAPCDIVGDISYEELRAEAYEDAKRGMNLQSIVEKERNVEKSKLVEFEKLLSEPYKMPLNSSLGANANPFPVASPNNGPLSVSSFSQLGASLNMGFERSSAPLTNTLAQSNFFGNGGNTLASNTLAQSNFFGSGGNTLASNTLAQSNFFGSGGNTLASNTPAQLNFFGSGGNTLVSNTPAQSNFFGSGGNTLASNTLSQSNFFGGGGNTSASNTANQSGGGFSVSQSSPFSQNSSTTTFQTTSDVQSLSNSQGESASGDLSIWFKEKWNPGEIPEEAPPDSVCR